MIQMTGIDHRAAPVEIRSLFAFRSQEMIDLMKLAVTEYGADGAVLLTTCNRTELYVSGCGEETDLTGLLCTFRALPQEEYAPYFTTRRREEAVSHLFALTAGLRSAIVAEDQILTQVNDALSFAREAQLTDRVLEELFRRAVTAAKKVKSEVVFTYANRTAIDEALSCLSREGFDPAGKTCMVIGNGEYGRLAAETLCARGADVTMTIRQYHSGMVLIPEGCRKILYGEKMHLFPRCDLVISATKSPNYTLFYDQVSACRIDHPMILIDFAVPHDIDPQIRKIEGIRVYTVDDFQSVRNPENDEALEAAGRILEEAQATFEMRINRQDLLPRIGRIGAAAGEDAKFRMRRDVRRLDISQPEKDALLSRIDSVTGKITEKILFRLRDELDEETLRRCIEILEHACDADEQRYH